MPRRSSVAFISALALGAGMGGCGGGDGADTSRTTATSSTTPATTTAEVAKVDMRKAGATEVKVDGDWLVATDDAIWISGGTELDRLDPKTGEKTGVVRISGGPCLSPAYAFGALFAATCFADKGLVRIDPQTLEVTKSINLPITDLYNQEGTIAAGEEAVWIIIDG